MKYDLKKELKLTADSLLGFAAAILLIAVTLSFLARIHWFTDIFSHFLVQYIIGAIVLGLYYTLTRQMRMALMMVAVMIICLTETYLVQTHMPPAQATQVVSIMQYNRLIYQTKHDDLAAYLREKTPDIVILQEAGAGYNRFLHDMAEIYPYQINETRAHAFGMVILSRHNIRRHELINLSGDFVDNFVIRLEIEIPDLEQPLLIYALHAIPPVGNVAWKQRNSELQKISLLIEEDSHDYVIMAGDWNITPYSPFFKDILKETGLNYQESGIFPLATWPSTFLFPLFQVEIDHVLFSNHLTLLHKETDPVMGSDHYPLIATFGLSGS